MDQPESKILFIFGDGDESRGSSEKGTPTARVTRASDLRKLVDERLYERLHVSRNFFRHARDVAIGDFEVIVNLITEPVQNARALNNLRKILRGVPGRVVNRPDAVLTSTRDRVARLLSGIPNLIVPRTLAIAASKSAPRVLEAAGIEPPIILRCSGTHGGQIAGCFDSIEAAMTAFERGRDHVVTQFVDFRSDDGLYRKYRVYFMGEQTILRHMLVSDHWNVHAKDRTRFMAERPELIAEERSLFETEADPFAPKVRRVLEEVRRRMPLDFFGMDFGVMPTGEVVLFEANATMRFFPYSPLPEFAYLIRSFAPAQAAFRTLIGLPPVPARAPAYEIQLQHS